MYFNIYTLYCLCSRYLVMTEDHVITIWEYIMPQWRSGGYKGRGTLHWQGEHKTL